MERNYTEENKKRIDYVNMGNYLRAKWVYFCIVKNETDKIFKYQEYKSIK